MLGTLAIGIAKLPRRVENTEGSPCATKEQAAQIIQLLTSCLNNSSSVIQANRIIQLLEEHQKYSEQRNHDILNGQGKIQGFIANQIDKLEGKIWGKLDQINRDILELERNGGPKRG